MEKYCLWSRVQNRRVETAGSLQTSIPCNEEHGVTSRKAGILSLFEKLRYQNLMFFCMEISPLSGLQKSGQTPLTSSSQNVQRGGRTMGGICQKLRGDRGCKLSGGWYPKARISLGVSIRRVKWGWGCSYKLRGLRECEWQTNFRLPPLMLVATHGFICAAFHSIQLLVSGSGRASDLLRCAREQTDTEGGYQSKAWLAEGTECCKNGTFVRN